MSRQDKANAFMRSKENGWIGGVCAGIAEYFGFNLAATRFLAVLSLLFAPPVTLFAYVAAVLLIPARKTLPEEPNIRKSMRSAPKQTMGDMRSRFKALDRRLARLEKTVTSSRFQLDQEFRELEKNR